MTGPGPVASAVELVLVLVLLAELVAVLGVLGLRQFDQLLDLLIRWDLHRWKGDR